MKCLIESLLMTTTTNVFMSKEDRYCPFLGCNLGVLLQLEMAYTGR